MMSDTKYFLALNTAEGFLQIAIGSVGGGVVKKRAHTHALLASVEWRLPSQGAEVLTPLLSSLTHHLNIPLQAFHYVACVTGPGSFTGIRLATSTLSALRRTIHVKTAGLPYLPLLAYSAMQHSPSTTLENQTFWSITHARRELVHMQSFSFSTAASSLPQATSGIHVLTPTDACAILTASQGQNTIYGSGVSANSGTFTQLATNEQHVTLLPSIVNSIPSQCLFAIASSAQYSIDDIDPNYIRASDAEESLEQIATKLGLEPIAARNALEKFVTQTP